MKKRRRIVFMVTAAALLLLPVRKVYEDGGTHTYTALAYKVIIWNQTDGRSGTEFHIFPDNFHRLDHYERLECE